MQVTFANVGRLFASLEPGPALDTLDELFTDLMKGVRAYPIKLPGTAFYGALQVQIIISLLRFFKFIYIKYLPTKLAMYSLAVEEEVGGYF